jgi:hypothetical protein
MDRTKEIVTLVCEFLEVADLGYRLRDDETSIEAGFRGKQAMFKVIIGVRDEPLCLSVFVHIPILVPEDRRRHMAETINRANYGLGLGCFEMDASEGTMGFRSAMPVVDGTVTQDQIRDLLFSALMSVDQYHRAFNRLLYGDDLSPAEVIAEVEMSD